MKIKRIISVILTVVLLMISIPTETFPVSAATETTYKVGDIIEFGSYKQSAIKNANGETTGFNVEPIKWRILKIENGKALLISDKIIDTKQYNSTSATVDGYYGNNYAHSDIREWLIEDFYNTAFSSAEKNCIVATTLDNSAAPTSVNASGSYTKYSSESTTDKVFLLSKDEANSYASKYFGTTATDYAYANGFALGSGAGSTLGVHWLLRTAGNNTFQIYYVHMRSRKYVTYFNWNDDAIRSLMGIRPAIYVDLENYSNNKDDFQASEYLNNIEFGPYALQGATISILGYDIPLIDIEANITLNIADNLKIITDEETNIKILIGFDESSSANIQGSSSSPTYWSDSYKEVKAMYQDLTGKKVDTTRLWNKFSSLRGKLKKINGNMVVDVSTSLAGYIEFENTDSGYSFSDGGIIAAFDAATSLRSYWGPCYVALGIEAGVEGSLTFTNENNKINPQISVSPSFTISVGAGIGGRNSYAQIDAYGTLSTIISTSNTETPFRAGLDLGVRWMGFVIGKEIFSGNKSFTNIELYPEFGTPWQLSKLSLMPEINISDKESYNKFINSALPINRDYLSTTYSLRSTSNFTTDGINFSKNKSYPLNQVSMVSFEDDTLLLVWIEDTGNKAIENIGTLTYSYFDGKKWCEPKYLFENGTANDMPYLYSDGEYAYIVWQKANKIFEENTSTSDMLQNFDLCATIFDSKTQTFTDELCINTADDTIFEFNPVIYGNDGTFTVAWNENTDNNIYQMSGTNSLNIYSFDKYGNLVNKNTLNSTNIYTNIKTSNSGIYFSQSDLDNIVLYHYDSSNTLHTIATEIYTFDCTKDAVFYSDSQGLHSIRNEIKVDYKDINSLNNFVICENENKMVLFTTELNKDFTNSLYFSEFSFENNKWSDFEIYCNEKKYIRNYSPVILSDNSIFSVFNYIEIGSFNNNQFSLITVNQPTENIDIELKYVDFNDSQLNSGSIDMKIAIKNNCSSAINSLNIYILDNEEKVVFSETRKQTLAAFEEKIITFKYNIPNNYNNEIYTIRISPTKLQDLNSENNSVITTFECIHIINENWNIDILPSINSYGIISQHCLTCNKIFNKTKLGDANYDDKINSLDLTNLRIALLSDNENYSSLISCDTTGNGRIDIIDLIRLKKILLDITESDNT